MWSRDGSVGIDDTIIWSEQGRNERERERVLSFLQNPPPNTASHPASDSKGTAVLTRG
jgi:hypothetical protein